MAVMALGQKALGQNKTVVLATSDLALRQRLRASLTGMRWTVLEASGGAEAMAAMDDGKIEALMMDHWLPDLEAGEFAGQIPVLYPGVDVLRLDGDPVEGAARSPRRHELLHALREALDGAPVATVKTDGPAWASAPVAVPLAGMSGFLPPYRGESAMKEPAELSAVREMQDSSASLRKDNLNLPVAIAEMIGSSGPMLELARLIRLVAPRSATVLIEGETGSGKEVVAHALHRLSKRAQKPFAVLNCAAIPEALLEAELFGHTRGAFTGAVSSRTGRIETANGGTLFLDEIGEMPLSLQAKLLRFLECGELQRVGDNEVVRVDVRVIAATHQPLEQRAAEGMFRLDLYHRLAVFPMEVPPLRERRSDIRELSEFFLARLGVEAPRKKLSAEAMARLEEHDWPGNVRELAHVLERATILAGDAPEIGVGEIRLRRGAK